MSLTWSCSCRECSFKQAYTLPILVAWISHLTFSRSQVEPKPEGRDSWTLIECIDGRGGVDPVHSRTLLLQRARDRKERV